MTANLTLRVGQIVEISEERVGTIRYIGSIAAAPGEYVGIELDAPTGKNDGSAKGQRYFQCAPNHGLFMRRNGVVRVLEELAPDTAVKDAQRPSPSRKTSQTDSITAKRLTLNAPSPTPSARSHVSRLGLRSPTRVNRPARSTSISSTTSSARAPTPVERRFPIKPSLSSRPSASSAQSRRSSVASSVETNDEPQSRNVSATSSTFAVPRLPSSASGAARPQTSASHASSVAKDLVEGSGMHALDRVRTAVRAGDGSRTAATSEDDTTSRASDASPPSSQTAREQPPDVDQTPRANRTVEEPQSARRPSLSLSGEAVRIGRTREIEALVAKIRVIEKKRMQDREQLKSLERIQAERDRFENVIQKLQSKYQPQQQELAQLRLELKGSQQKLAEIGNGQTDNDAALEMATLDREVAEETAEALRLELEALKARAEELDEEVKLLREENDELGKGVSEQDRTSQGWLQLEKSNERLKEALLRLREVTAAQETELKDEVKTLQQELKKLAGIEEQDAALQTRLQQSDAIIQDLKQQLELAASSDEMIEELTEQNLTLTERIDNLKSTVADLEDLKELNDELETGHLEAERQLQEELDRRDTLLAEFEAKSTQQKAKLDEYEITVAKFRQLVSSLQAHIEDLKTSKNITDAEAQSLTTRERELLSTNAKLQSAVEKSQIHAIELEKSRFEAQQATEHLKLTKMFLLDGTQNVLDALNILFIYKRIEFKANLLRRLIREDLSGNTGSLRASTLDWIQTLDHLLLLGGAAQRQVFELERCPPEKLDGYRAQIPQATRVDQSLQNYVDAFARSEMSTASSAIELDDHVQRALSSISASDANLSAQLQQDTFLLSGRINISLLVLDLMRAVIPEAPTDGEVVPNEEQYGQGQPSTIINSVRRITAELHRAESATSKVLIKSPMVDFKEDTSMLDVLEQCAECLETQQSLTSTLQDLFPIVNTDNDKASQSSTSKGIMTTSSIAVLALQHAQNLVIEFSKLEDLVRSAPTRNQTSNASQSPFTLLAAKLRDAAATTATTINEEEVDNLRTALKSAESSLLASTSASEEQSLRITLLETRIREATAKASRILEVESLLASGQQREQELSEQLRRTQDELEVLKQSEAGLRQEKETREKMDEEARAKAAEEARAKAVAAEDEGFFDDSDTSHGNSAAQIALLKAEIGGLQGTVRYLRGEKARRTNGPLLDTDPRASPISSLKNDLSAMSWLTAPLASKLSAEEQTRSDTLAKRAKQGNALWDDFLDIVSNSDIISLKDSFTASQAEDEDQKTPIDRLKWRPLEQKTAWIAAKHREDWEAWIRKSEHFVHGGP